MTIERYVSSTMLFTPYYRTFVDQLPQLVMYIADEKKKNIEIVYFSRKVTFILFIFPRVTKYVPDS